MGASRTSIVNLSLYNKFSSVTSFFPVKHHLGIPVLSNSIFEEWGGTLFPKVFEGNPSISVNL